MADSTNGPPSFCTQADALLRKNLTYQKRNVCANIRMLSFPIIILLLFAFLNVTYKISILKERLKTEADDRSVCFGINCPVPDVPEIPQRLPVPDCEFRAVRTDSSPFHDLPDGSCRRRKSCPATVLFTGEDHSFAENLAWRMFPSSSSSANMVLGSSSTNLYYIQSRCPANSTLSPAGIIDSPTCLEGLRLWRNSSSQIKNELSSGFLKGNSKGEINEIIAAYDFLNSSKSNFNVISSYNYSTNTSSIVNLVSNAFLQYQNPGSRIFLEFFKKMPSPRFLDPEVDFSSILGLLFYEWIVLQLFPVVLMSLVYEREQKLHTMMKMHGLGDGPYWIISYAYFLIICSLYIFLFVAFGSSLGIGFFRSNSFVIQFVFYFLFVNLQISVAFLASKAFSNLKTASVTAYLFVFATGLVSDMVFRGLIEDTVFPRWLVTALEIYPGFSLYRGLYEFSTYALEENGMQWDDLSDRENGMKKIFVIMFVEWITAISVSIFSNKAGRILFLFGKTAPRSRNEEENRVENDDIIQEIEKVNTMLSNDPKNTGHAVVCDNLRKVYAGKDGNPEKAAVKGLTLALPERQCFGMLGPNGAGKTSFISMMVGLTNPTSGSAFVQGLDIRTRMDEIYTRMGVCPQHDLLWETLTAREHLLFYGRLKNLKGSLLTQAVEESLSSVNLLHGGVADKQVKRYSGGMKRRLSVAISLIGNPKIVYMDEPSSGLDPASRYQLWNVVKRAKQSHAIMLTTHSMEEAEALCDRLGFMVDGRLQCIGTPNELKARFGGSYVLTMTSPGHEEEVEELVRILFPSSVKLYQLSGTLKFEVPKSEARVADVFRAVNYAKSSFPVLAWGIADTSLEDIFIKVCRQVDDDSNNSS